MQRKGSTFPDRRLLADRAGASFFQFTKLSGIRREHMLNHLVYSKNVQTDALFSLH